MTCNQARSQRRVGTFSLLHVSVGAVINDGLSYCDDVHRQNERPVNVGGGHANEAAANGILSTLGVREAGAVAGL